MRHGSYNLEMEHKDKTMAKCWKKPEKQGKKCNNNNKSEYFHFNSENVHRLNEKPIWITFQLSARLAKWISCTWRIKQLSHLSIAFMACVLRLFASKMDWMYSKVESIHPTWLLSVCKKTTTNKKHIFSTFPSIWAAFLCVCRCLSMSDHFLFCQ